MKKLFSFIITIMAYMLPAYSQQLHIDSTRFIGGTKPATQINYAIPTTDKGILLVGIMALIPGGVIPYFSFDTVLENVLIGKIDSNQKISWIKVYGGSQDDNAVSVCQTPDGGFAVLAGTNSHDGDVSGLKRGGIWLLRIDGSGNLLWQKTYGSTESDVPISIANTLDGGFVLFGATNGSDNDVPFHYGSIWTFDWLVIKTDNLGNVQWTKDLGTSGDEGESGSILSIDSNYYLISATISGDHDCTDTAWHSGVSTGSDYYILKLDDTGKVLWDSSYGGSGTENAIFALYDTRDSTIVITGSTYSNDYMVTGYNGGGDMWVMKVNKNGTLVWQKTLGDANQDGATSICANANGGYMAYGGTTYGPMGGEDAWLFLIDNAGNEIANKIFGGTDNETPNSIVPYLKSYAATGTSGSSVFTEGSCNINYSGAYVSYADFGTLSVNKINSIAPTISVLPNPTQGNIKIITPANEQGNLTITNIIGQVIYTGKWEADHTDINTIDWAEGLYLVLWQGEDGSVLITKLIKN